MTSQFAQLPVAPLPTPDYTGFTRWVQVMPQPKPKKVQPNPGQSCNPRRQSRVRAALP